jgi:hypothetical protein
VDNSYVSKKEKERRYCLERPNASGCSRNEQIEVHLKKKKIPLDIPSSNQVRQILGVDPPKGLQMDIPHWRSELVYDWDRVNKVALGLDVLGFGADILLPLQPIAESAEAVELIKTFKIINSTMALNIDMGDAENKLFSGQYSEIDWINTGLDTISLIPEVGIFGSGAGVAYNLYTGFDLVRVYR